MAKRIFAIVGSYRKGGMVDSAVDAILEGAREKGAATHKIYLLDKHIEFCTNCRSCMQEPGPVRGKCVHQDDMNAILDEMEAADALVIGSPVNFFNTTAIFRRFLERLAVYAYWPWGKERPDGRIKQQTKKAVLVISSAAPGFLIPLATGAPKALKAAAQVIGARTVGKLCIGLSSRGPQPKLSARKAAVARKMGAALA
jgi:NAD(P)H-dependent FMN reductase